MLVVTRNSHQSVLIGDNILVTFLGIKGGRCRLGFDAPRNVRILRPEVDPEAFRKTGLILPSAPASLADVSPADFNQSRPVDLRQRAGA